MPARGSVLPGFRVPDEFLDGIRLCEWPGRSQVLKLDSVTYFLDGAHTPKSLQVRTRLSNLALKAAKGIFLHMEQGFKFA